MENYLVEVFGNMEIVHFKGIKIVNNNQKKHHIKWVIDGLQSLPTLVINLLTSENLVIRIDDNSCDYFKENPTVLGFFHKAGFGTDDKCTFNNIIYIKKENVLRKKRFQETLFHEIGHFIDYYGTTLFTEENKTMVEDIFNNEGNYIFNTYGNYYKKNLKEFFAQSFCAYVIRDAKFFEKCPKMETFVCEAILRG